VGDYRRLAYNAPSNLIAPPLMRETTGVSHSMLHRI
jgi:hypothetical protein